MARASKLIPTDRLRDNDGKMASKLNDYLTIKKFTIKRKRKRKALNQIMQKDEVKEQEIIFLIVYFH